VAWRSLPGIWTEQDCPHCTHECNRLQVRGFGQCVPRAQVGGPCWVLYWFIPCPLYTLRGLRSIKPYSESSTACAWLYLYLAPYRRAHQNTPARLRLVASKSAYDLALAAKQPVDNHNVYGHTKNLFEKTRHWMSLGVYKPVLDVATVSCQQRLSWWK
jgi:hypothetical protein